MPVATTTQLVMPGLDPGIHVVWDVQLLDDRAHGAAWMPGSSPGMTISDYNV